MASFLRVAAFIAGVCFIAWLGVIGGLFVFQRTLLYPAAQVQLHDDWATPGVSRVIVVTADGERLRGYWKPPAFGGPVVVTFHGNASSVVTHGARFAGPPWSTGGWGFLAIAWRGYPGSTGSPSEDGLFADGDAAVAFVEKQAPGAPILFHGHSLGTGVAVAMAARHPSKGLYLEGAYDTMTAVAVRLYPYAPGFILRDTFRSVDLIAKVASPVLAVHGLADVVIPAERGLALVAAARRGSRFVGLAGIDHNDVFGARDGEAEAFFRPLASVKPRIVAETAD